MFRKYYETCFKYTFTYELINYSLFNMIFPDDHYYFVIFFSVQNPGTLIEISIYPYYFIPPIIHFSLVCKLLYKKNIHFLF